VKYLFTTLLQEYSKFSDDKKKDLVAGRISNHDVISFSNNMF